MPAGFNVPVVLIVFNRPDCARRVLAAIRCARPGRLFVVADGPRAGAPGDAGRVAEVRAIVDREIDWPCEVRRDFADENLGCARRVSSGLDAVFAQVEAAIVLEDDCVPDASFFPFAAELLERFRADPRVGGIAGNSFQRRAPFGTHSYYFSRYPHCWGWATWRRAWSAYDHAMTAWPEAKRAGWLADFLGDRREAAYWEGIFDRAQAGEIDSWAYRWTLACWRHDQLTALPAVNLVANIGIGPAATHTRSARDIAAAAARSLDFPLRHPEKVDRHRAADRYTYRRRFEPSRWRRWWWRAVYTCAPR